MLNQTQNGKSLIDFINYTKYCWTFKKWYNRKVNLDERIVHE